MKIRVRTLSNGDYGYVVGQEDGVLRVELDSGITGYYDPSRLEFFVDCDCGQEHMVKVNGALYEAAETEKATLFDTMTPEEYLKAATSHLDPWPKSEDEDLKIGRRGVKAPLHEIPVWALHGVARVFSYGSRKYAPGNWVKAAKDGEQALEDYLSAALRHWGACQEWGWDALDDESDLPHLDHLICSLIMLRGIATKAEILERDPGKGKEPE